MGKKMAVVTLCVLACVCTTVFALGAAWKPLDRPPVSLRLALALAEEDLEKDAIEYFCIGASLAKTFSSGDWELQFSSEQGTRIWVSVGSDRTIRKSQDGFEY